MFKHSKLFSSIPSSLYNGLNTLHTQFYNFQNFGFARNTRKITPIFRGDKVLVLPPWGTAKLSSFAKAKVKQFHKEDSKIQVGTVLRIMRKKGLAIVSNVNEKPKYVTPAKFLNDYEFGNIQKIRRKIVNLPVALERVKLRCNSGTGKYKIVNVEMIKNEEGKTIRINKLTKQEIPSPLKKRDFSYAKRALGRKDGIKDTPAPVRSTKTYFGENFVDIAKNFVSKIKSKENIESKLILKDK